VTDGAAGVEAGIAWYDIPSRSVGPDHLPTLVRSRMRDAVHRKLTETRPSTLRVLLGVLDELSSYRPRCLGRTQRPGFQSELPLRTDAEGREQIEL
jgi:hypothetical protein